jgi:hypothetical protein
VVKLKDYGNVDVCIGMEKMCMDITEVENINVESQTQGRGCNSVVKYLPSRYKSKEKQKNKTFQNTDNGRSELIQLGS